MASAASPSLQTGIVKQVRAQARERERERGRVRVVVRGLQRVRVCVYSLPGVFLPLSSVAARIQCSLRNLAAYRLCRSLFLPLLCLLVPLYLSFPLLQLEEKNSVCAVAFLSHTRACCQVLSGDTIVIRGQPRGGPPPERTLSLASIQAPRPARRPNAQGENASNDDVCC
jgi:hypothetical protein